MPRPFTLLAGACLAASCIGAMAAPPLFGGWRNLATSTEAPVREENMPFAMLPVEVARGTRLALLDAQRKRTVCCFEVVSVPLQDPTLRHRFDLPEVWITDLRNGWDLEGRPYAPLVFALQRRDALLDYRFAEHSYDHLGGLLVPAQAQVTAQGTLQLDERQFTLHIDAQAMANDNGSLTRYTLTDTRAPQHTYTVDVPFATY